MTARLAGGALRIYGMLRAGLWPGPSCRFFPSCSQYAEQALSRHGLLHGLRLTGGRLLRCHPFHPGGYDPVPARRGTSLKAGTDL